MSRDYQLHPEVAAAMDHLASYEGVDVSVRAVRESRLSGGEATLIVIGFVLSGFFGGLLSKAGEEFWSALKSFVARLHRSNETKKRYELVVYIKETSPTSAISFKYNVSIEGRSSDLDSFREAAERECKKLRSNALIAPPVIDLEYLEEGRWRERD